jgi:hypothetical protein
MNRRKLGPPPSWIPAAKPAQEPEAAPAADPMPVETTVADPLQNIFTASRTARLGDTEDDQLIQVFTNRRNNVTDAAITAEVSALLTAEKKKAAPFSEILLYPSSNADIRDVRNTRLVVLQLAHGHQQGNGESIARRKSAAFLSHYGVGPRRYRNSLIFVAPDPEQLQQFTEEVRTMLAWRSLVEQHGGLEPRQIDRARAHVNRFADRKEIALREVFRWLLVPTQADPATPLEWQEIPLDCGLRTLAEAAAQTLSEAGLVRIDDLGLAEEIDAARAWIGDSVPAGPQLADEFARHLFLPRLINERVLQTALQSALAAGIKQRVGPGGPKRLYSATLRLDTNDIARIAPQLLSQLTSIVSPVDLKFTLSIDALVPDASRPQIESIISESDRGTKRV